MKVLLQSRKPIRYYLILKSQLSFDFNAKNNTHPEKVTVKGKTKTYIATRHKSNATKTNTKKDSGEIANFGEHIGGSRAEQAALKKIFDKKPVVKKTTDGIPAWKKKYSAQQNSDGRWELLREDKRKWGTIKRKVDGALFDTQEEANRFIPVAELLRNHGVSQMRDNDWYIRRRLSTGRALTLRGGFQTKEDALKYMYSHAEELMKQKPPSPDRPYLDKLERSGKDYRSGDVTPQMFHDTFGFRGGEFGNWNKGGDGQAALNYAYDALMDLAGVLKLPPKDISLDGELSIAFGARGVGGKQSARAHYEPERAVINLTKIRGAGALAHEWFHAFDQYVGRMDGKAPTERINGKFQVDMSDRGYSTHGLSHNSKLSPRVQAALKDFVTSLNEKTLIGEYDNAKDTARLNHQTKAIESLLDGIRNDLIYWAGKRNKEFSEADTVAFRKLAQRIIDGDVGEPVNREHGRSFRGLSLQVQSFAPVEELNAIYKKVVGRSFSKNDEQSTGQRLYRAIRRRQITQQSMEADRKKGNVEKRIKTDYAKSAKDIDDTRSSPYWGTTHEMAARAFEAFVEDKIHEHGKSQYLVHSANNDVPAYKMFNMKPYPEGEERSAINRKIEILLEAIRETN